MKPFARKFLFRLRKAWLAFRVPGSVVFVPSEGSSAYVGGLAPASVGRRAGGIRL